MAHLPVRGFGRPLERARDRKSTRLNSSHTIISYAVFCLQKKKGGPKCAAGRSSCKETHPTDAEVPLTWCGVPAFFLSFFFFNDTATTEIYTLSLHDALPICACPACSPMYASERCMPSLAYIDRKSTRLNSSHTIISYAVFCLKKKKKHYGVGGLEVVARELFLFLLTPVSIVHLGVPAPSLDIEVFSIFFFKDPATTEIYPLPQPAPLPI